MLMKISRLLVLSALWLTGLGANAVELNERTQPTNADVPKTAVEFVVGKQYLLYNVTADKYFCQGNTWGTRGCVGPVDAAARVKVAKYTIDEVWDEHTYEIEDYVSPRSGKYSWYKMCMDDSGNIYTDQTTWGNRFYDLVSKGSNTYRIMPNENNALHQSDGTQFLGWDESVPQDFSNAWADLADDSERYPISAMLTEGTGIHLDWQFFDATIFDIYDASVVLKEQILAAEAEGVDVTSAAGVYNNPSATLEQIEAATEALKSARANNTFGLAKDGEPLDVTKLITNPSYDNNNNEGWEGDAPAFQSYTNAERFNNNYDVHQSLGNVPAGLFMVNVEAFYRAGGYDDAYTAWQSGSYAYNASLYATVGEDTNEATLVDIFSGAAEEKINRGSEPSKGEPAIYFPNDMNAAEGYFLAGRYLNTLVFEVTNPGDLTIGLKKSEHISNDWTCWDNWHLTYAKPGAQAYKALLQALLDQICGFEPGEDDAYTTSYYEAYKALGTASTTPSSTEELLAAFESVKSQVLEAQAALTKNIKLWKELANEWNKAQADILNHASDFDQNSESYIWLEDGKYYYDQAVNNGSYTKTNEEIEEEIAMIKEMITDCLQHTSGNVDVTGLMNNPDFATNTWDGWTREAASGGAVQVKNSCAEAWNNANFKIYQTIENAPVGVYRIQVQGFYRYLRGDNAWNNRNVYGKGKEKEVPCYVFMNSKKTPFMNIFEEKITDSGIYTSGDYNTFTDEDGVTYYFPDQMWTAADAFASPSTIDEEFNMYTQTAWGLVAREGDTMEIGVTGASNQGGDSWVIFDNFKLMRMEPTVDVVQPVLSDEITNANNLLAKPMGKSQKNALREAIKAASSAVSGSNGTAMFDALQALFEAEDNCLASVEKFTAVEDAKKRLAIANEDAVTNLDAEVAAMMAELDAALTEGTIEDEDVDDLVARVDALIIRLNTPDYSNASDTNPADFSGLIKNGTYADNNQDGWTADLEKQDDGDTNYRAADGVGEIFSQNYVYYQDMMGLPAGTYGLNVQGFYRAGGAEDDWATQSDASLNNAFLFASTSEGEFAKALVRLASEANSNDSPDLTDGFAWAQQYSDGTGENPEVVDGFEVADNTSASASEFDADKYHNGIILKVADDGKLRLGLRKSSWVAKDWTCFDNWKLLYYGKSSSRTPDTAGVSEMNMNNNLQKVEYFTVDGRRANVAHKGLFIVKQTMTNGNVVVKKINK